MKEKERVWTLEESWRKAFSNGSTQLETQITPTHDPGTSEPAQIRSQVIPSYWTPRTSVLTSSSYDFGCFAELAQSAAGILPYFCSEHSRVELYRDLYGEFPFPNTRSCEPRVTWTYHAIAQSYLFSPLGLWHGCLLEEVLYSVSDSGPVMPSSPGLGVSVLFDV